MSKPDVVVVGGGWAGLAAATRLVQAGAGVTLFEQSKELGGRCSSFYDPDFGEWLDNGPHVFIGAYRAALGLMDVWGAIDGIDFDGGREIPFIYPDGREERLKIGGKGGAIAALASLMSFKGMPLRDRLKTARAVRALMRTEKIDPHSEPTVAEFLSRYGIGESECGGFWNSLTVAVMNAPPRLAGLSPMIRGIREGLISGGSGSRLGKPIKPFQQLYIEPAKRYLLDKGVEVRTSEGAKRLLFAGDNRIVGVETSKRRIETDKVILAIPPVHRHSSAGDGMLSTAEGQQQFVLNLLPDRWRNDEFFSRFRSFRFTPIASVHITFDRAVLRDPISLFPGAFTHWAFGRGEDEGNGWSRISTITSNAPGKNEMTTDEIVERTLSDLRERLTGVKSAEVKHIRCVRTLAATVLLEPGSELIRPDAKTPINGLYLAGDWCATGLSATIESAARAGETAAEEAVGS
ncbi:FAD-dependent oxidoreductase [bacterium]|nr:FAD-dependent oxidoreductase [bacterium]